MSEGRYDSLIDIAAGAVMAGAVGYCLFTGWSPDDVSIAGGGGLLAFAGTFGVMRKVAPTTTLETESEPIVPEALDFTTEEDVVDAPVEDEPEADDQSFLKPAPDVPYEGELVLDDIVAELEPQSRVVRLFAPEVESDPAALRARVDRHLAGEAAAEDERALLATKPELSDDAVAATNRLAAALDRVRQRLD